jgi:DNA processing protein
MLRPHERFRLAEQLAGPGALVGLSRFAAMRLLGRGIRSGSWDPTSAVNAAEADCRYLTARGWGSTFWWEPGFPPLLREIYDPPVALYYRGTLPDAEATAVGVVGTRLPTGSGRRGAFQIARELAEQECVVVSGLARGIDACAHEGALSADGTTVAVLGSGVDRVYPSGNRRIASRMLGAGGCLISEFPPGAEPFKHHFPCRNRLISGMSVAVVIVEAPAKSGALITARYALDQGRDVLVHGTGVDGPRAAGTAGLVSDGAAVVRRGREILAEVGHGSGPPFPLPAGATARQARTSPTGKTALTGTSLHRLGKLLDDELAGRAAHYQGEYYSRH